MVKGLNCRFWNKYNNCENLLKSILFGIVPFIYEIHVFLLVLYEDENEVRCH